MREKIDRAALGVRLKEAREYEGFSQEEVAKYLGLPRSAISLIESGARGIDFLELKKLATLYKCTIDQLTGTEKSKDVEPDSVKIVARATAALSPQDQSEVLRFVQLLQSRWRKRE